MSGDKRSVTTDALETLGTIIDGRQKRDAIHLAVEPVIAGEDFHPGTHINVIDGVAFYASPGSGLGIVDPFLLQKVNKGERFWFVMYPRTVHSLRHVWTHPAFPDEIGAVTEETPAAILEARKIESENWLREFCENKDGYDCPDYETVIELISNGELREFGSEGGYSTYTEESLYFFGHDAHGLIPPEFWVHAENVLGCKLDKRPQYFSCSC